MDDSKVAQYCKEHPFYQNIDGIVIPCTPELIIQYFLKRRRFGPKAVQARFKDITKPLIIVMTKMVPKKLYDFKTQTWNEEWLEVIDST